MRKLLLSLAVVALAASACSSSAMPASTGRPVVDPGHHLPAASAAPYDGVTHEDPGVNPWVDPREDDQSTFGLDVDTASYTIAQRYVADGNRPDPASVRVEEWVNAFDQGYPEPRDETFTIVADGGPTPFTERDEVLLRVGLQARSVADRARDRAALTFVVDTSGSMARENRLEVVKDALRILVTELDADDRVAIVTFGDNAGVVLPPTAVRDDRAILAAIDGLQPGGSTNLEAGLRLGYRLARETLTEDGIDRVILASDGVANVGLTNAEDLLDAIRRDAAAGIELVSVGVGMGNFNDALLEQLADEGDGFYAYVNTLDEARRLFRDDLTSTLETVALDARAQVTFNRDLVEAYRLVGYENRAIDDGSFTDDTVDAGAIGAGHAVTALYALRLAEDGRDGDPLATVDLRWTDPTSQRPVKLRRVIDVRDLARSFEDSDPHFRFDVIVAEAAEVLRLSELTPGTSLRDVRDVAARESRSLPATDEVHAFLDLLAQLDEMPG
jgi:Ca-activated chloride channel homolog